MSEYDIALDCQVDWASFWSSDEGRAFFHLLGAAVSKQRQGKGERQFSEILENESDELQLVLKPIINGECYYWSTEILEVIKTASKSLPDSWALMKPYVPAIAGFFYFAKELENGERAFGWNILSVDLKDPTSHVAALYIPGEDRPMPDFNAVALTTFVTNPDPGFPRPIPCRTSIVVGETLKDWKMEAVKHAAEINADVNEFTRDYESIRLFATMLTFISQRILVPYRSTVSRATKKRVERITQQRELDVNVIRLRSILRHQHEGQGEPVEWSCRWIVHGHWREQWFSSLGRHQPVFINPYVKGPEDKPLKDPGRLFAVVR